MRILGLHHVAIAVDDIEKYSKIFNTLFGLKSGKIEHNPESKVSLSMVDLDNSEVEFIKSSDSDSAISKFLDKRGPGIHHFCLAVDDINKAVNELIAKGVKMIDQKPRKGAGGSMIAFIHPESAGGILIELKQQKK